MRIGRKWTAEIDRRGTVGMVFDRKEKAGIGVGRKGMGEIEQAGVDRTWTAGVARLGVGRKGMGETGWCEFGRTWRAGIGRKGTAGIGIDRKGMAESVQGIRKDSYQSQRLGLRIRTEKERKMPSGRHVWKTRASNRILSPKLKDNDEICLVMHGTECTCGTDLTIAMLLRQSRCHL